MFLKSNTKRDRNLGSILDPVRCSHGKVQPITRFEFEPLAAVVVPIFERQITMGCAAEESFQVLLAQDLAIILWKHVNGFRATDLQKKIVLGINVIRRYRAGRGDEDKTLPPSHPA